MTLSKRLSQKGPIKGRGDGLVYKVLALQAQDLCLTPQVPDNKGQAWWHMLWSQHQGGGRDEVTPRPT